MNGSQWRWWLVRLAGIFYIAGMAAWLGHERIGVVFAFIVLALDPLVHEPTAPEPSRRPTR